MISEVFRRFSGTELMSNYVDMFIVEYGSKKTKEIESKINSSEKIERFIINLKRKNLSPGENGFIEIVNSIPYFLFSKAETLCLGSLLAIYKWTKVSFDETYSMNEESVTVIIRETIKKAFKTSLNFNSDNLINRYIHKLGSLNSNIYSTGLSYSCKLAFEVEEILAIQKGLKTEFRMLQGLDEVNISPDSYKVKELRKKSCMFENQINKRLIEVALPLEVGQIVNISDANEESEDLFISINFFYAERLRSILLDYDKEGIGIYKDFINELEIEDPSIYAEEVIFRELWIKKNGLNSFRNNFWVWVCEFEKI